MEKIGIEDYYSCTSFSYFKIDYDKFSKENLPIYKDDDDRGVIRLKKNNYSRGEPGTPAAGFYALLERQNANQEWDSIEVKDLHTLFKIFTIIGDTDENIVFNQMSNIPIYYRKGMVTMRRKKELSFKPETILLHPKRDSLIEMLSSKDKANIELALILINNG